MGCWGWCWEEGVWSGLVRSEVRLALGLCVYSRGFSFPLLLLHDWSCCLRVWCWLEGCLAHVIIHEV